MIINFIFILCFRMKFIFLFFLVLFMGCLIDKIYGVMKKFKGIIGNLICRIICIIVCKRVCLLCLLVCSFVCKKICSGKRSEVSIILVDIYLFVFNILLY